MLSIMPPPKFKAFDSTGKPLAGGMVYTYVPGTSTPKATYADPYGNSANPNPVVLDSNGEAVIWLQGFYKILLTDSNNVQLWSVDQISSAPSVATPSAEWLPVNASFTFVSTTQFSMAGDMTPTFQPGRRMQATVSAGTIYGTVTSASLSNNVTTVTVSCDSGSLDSGLSAVSVGMLNQTNPSLPLPGANTAGSAMPWVDARVYASVAAAVSAIGSSQAVLFVSTAQAVSANITIPSNIALRFQQGGSLNISTGVTVTINGSVDAKLYRIFTLNGTAAVSLADVKEVYPQWFGAKGDGINDDTAAMQAAINSLPSAGGDVYFTPGHTYKITSTINITSNVVLTGGQTTWAVTNPPPATPGAVINATGVPASSNVFACTGATPLAGTIGFSNLVILGNTTVGTGNVFNFTNWNKVQFDNVYVYGSPNNFLNFVSGVQYLYSRFSRFIGLSGAYNGVGVNVGVAGSPALATLYSAQFIDTEFSNQTYGIYWDSTGATGTSNQMPIRGYRLNIAGTGNEAMWLKGQTDVSFVDCVFENGGQANNAHGNLYVANCNLVSFTQCWIAGNQGNAPTANGMVFEGCARVRVANCYISNSSTQGATKIYTLQIKGIIESWFIGNVIESSSGRAVDINDTTLTGALSTAPVQFHFIGGYVTSSDTGITLDAADMKYASFIGMIINTPSAVAFGLRSNFDPTSTCAGCTYPGAGTMNTLNEQFTQALNIQVNDGLNFTNQTSGAGASTATLTNAPAATNPNFWLPVTINGTTRYIPAW